MQQSVVGPSLTVKGNTTRLQVFTFLFQLSSETQSLCKVKQLTNKVLLSRFPVFQMDDPNIFKAQTNELLGNNQ